MKPSQPKKLWDLREATAAAARRRGWSARFGDVDRTQPQAVERLLRQAREEGCARIVAVGGDGTLNRLINQLARDQALAGTEVAIVPAGTCNDFARALHLSRKRLAEAFEVACSGG